MSQDELKPQPPSPAPPEQRSPDLLKAQIIKVLRGTIQTLEKLVVKLEAEPTPSTAPSFLDNLQVGWRKTLAKIRSFLPENLNLKLSDTALTSMVAGMSIILVWATVAILTTSPQAPEVARVPTSNSEPLPQAPEVAIPTSNSEPLPSSTITAPPELTAPATPEPVAVIPSPQLEPTPTPIVELTPEQNLIASIQNQISEVSDRFGDGLVQSIQADFAASSLTIKVADGWYNLKPAQQNKLADRMLKEARELDFSNVKITDLPGTLLARSPVVGNDMVIVVRAAAPAL